MKRSILLLLTSLFLAISLSAQMSDSQVLEFVKTEHAKGTNQQAIGVALVQRGVTQAQIERVKRQVEQDSANTSTNIGTTPSDAIIRTNKANENPVSLINESENPFSDELGLKIFGKNIFNQKNLSFAPDMNIPTPVGYKLGAGDEIVIEIWGASQASIRKTISPEGNINIENLGPISLSGMTIESANSYLKGKLSEIYAGINDDTSHIKVTLGQVRTIQVNIMGEVNTPGTYAISSLATIFHALYLAGGINDIGSLREVNLMRNGKKVTSVDIYDFLLHGKTASNIKIVDGDVIIVPTYKSLVDITGHIKRPMYYEMKENETVKNLIEYAGGFASGAYSDKISLVRKTGGYNKIHTLSAENTATFKVIDGDIVTIGEGLDLFDNRVQILGRVFRPGYYEIGQDINTVRNLIEKAGGLREDAYLGRAVLTREKDDLTFETIALNLGQVLSGSDNDITLKKNDVLSISAQQIEEDLGDFSIRGMVANPGSYKFAENTTVKDLILQAGGLLSSASTAKVDVSRRIIDPTSIQSATILAETYTFSIENGLIADGKSDFILKPYDQVYIRRSPGYQSQRNITVEGEVLFPGIYTITKKEQRISELVSQAGGLTNHAFLEGARLIRKQTEDELARQKDKLATLNRGVLQDSISTDMLDTDIYYTIGIDLDKAIAKPMSEYDIVLKPDDRLIIPEFDNTIKINGAVMYPNTVLYKEGKKLKHYIEQAGGYADNAEKSRAYVVYMNGTVAKAKGSSKSLIKPGAEIIVPAKEVKDSMSTSEKVAIGSSVTSMAAVVISLINTLSK